MAVADVFDALMHKRCYKDAWPVEQVLSHMREVAGQHLDPKYVDAHNSLGVALREAGRMDEALTHFETALRLSPGFAPAHLS